MAKTKKQKGGKYVGQGTSGCAFKNSALPCEGYQRPPHTLSKLVNKQTATTEFDIQQHFRAIDPERKYFLTLRGKCKFNPASFEPTNNSAKCTLLPFEDPYLIQMPEGGIDLEKIKIKASEVPQFFESIVTLFDGLILAHSHNIYHMDIKPPNIVSQKQKNGTFKTCFIDFGLSLFPGKAYDNVYTTAYKYWPPETALLNDYFRENFDKLNVVETNSLWVIQHIHEWKKAQEFYFELQPPTDNYTLLFRIQKQRYMRDYYGNLIYNMIGNPIVENYLGIDNDSILYIFKTNRNVNKNIISSKTDVFALGITFAALFHRLTGHFCGLSLPFTDLKIQLPTGTAYISQLTTADKPQAFLDWHIKVRNRVTLPLMKLVARMTNIFMALRPTLVEAKEEYEKLLPEIRKLFTQSNVEKFILSGGIVYQSKLLRLIKKPTEAPNVAVPEILNEPNVNNPLLEIGSNLFKNNFPPLPPSPENKNSLYISPSTNNENNNLLHLSPVTPNENNAHFFQPKRTLRANAPEFIPGEPYIGRGRKTRKRKSKGRK